MLSIGWRGDVVGCLCGSPVEQHPGHEQKDRPTYRIGEEARLIPIVLNESIPACETQSLIETCLNGIIDEIIVLNSAPTG